MPPRIPQLQCIRARSASQCPNASRAFSSSPSSQASTSTQKRRHRDPYAIAQAKARKAANLSRQEELKKERASSLGDPVRGITTPFVSSFDTALPPERTPSTTSIQTRTNQSSVFPAPEPKLDTGSHLNFFLSKVELESGIARSKWLTQPLPREDESDEVKSEGLRGLERPGNDGFAEKTGAAIDSVLGRFDIKDYTTDTTQEQRDAQTAREHENAQESLRRIASLSLGSSKDRLRVNMNRCIEVFGRHNTDQTLPPKPQAAESSNLGSREPRIGPDTGSSEVQIAILTAKIRALADGLELRGHPDKVNKRNLRLLVHRRAKLLKYLRRKERGGPRWQNLVDTLGLTDGTWKGEISL